MKALTTYVDEEIYQRLRKFSFDTNTSISKVIATAISYYIDSYISANNSDSGSNPVSNTNLEDISI